MRHRRHTCGGGAGLVIGEVVWHRNGVQGQNVVSGTWLPTDQQDAPTLQWFLYLLMSALTPKIHVSAWLGAFHSSVLHSVVCDVPGVATPAQPQGPISRHTSWGITAPVLPQPPDLSSLAMMVKSSPMRHRCWSLFKVTFTAWGGGRFPLLQGCSEVCEYLFLFEVWFAFGQLCLCFSQLLTL